MFACPAFVITAIGLEPAAASFVIAVCRRSWKALRRLSTPGGCERGRERLLEHFRTIGRAALPIAEHELVVALVGGAAPMLPELLGKRRRERDRADAVFALADTEHVLDEVDGYSGPADGAAIAEPPTCRRAARLQDDGADRA